MAFGFASFISRCRNAAAAAATTLILGASVSGALAFQQGEWVLGRWQGGQYWDAGVVEQVTKNGIVIQYDDGDREVTAPRNVRHYDWAKGTRVQCNWQQKGEWYAGRIASVSGSQIRIDYDDGDKETTGTGSCRSR